MTAPVLVFGWGNLSRGDDALGPLFVERLRALVQAGSPDGGAVDFLDDYQLQVEHALDLVGRRCVLFVDASLSCRAPFETHALQAAQDASFTTHAMSPQALMQVYCTLQGQPAPPCTLLAISGQHFELGEPPGAAALAHLDAAVHWALAWLAKATSQVPAHA
jgi:hydrogenase maturation protease